MNHLPRWLAAATTRASHPRPYRPMLRRLRRGSAHVARSTLIQVGNDEPCVVGAPVQHERRRPAFRAAHLLVVALIAVWGLRSVLRPEPWFGFDADARFSPLSPPWSIDADVPSEDYVIVTFASEAYMDRLFNFVASVQRWLPHNRIVVYSIGLSESSLAHLRTLRGVLMVIVMDLQTYPPHVHRLGNYAWKLLCIHDAVTRFKRVVTNDSGNEIRGPLGAVFSRTEASGWFFVEASNEADVLWYRAPPSMAASLSIPEETARSKRLMCMSGFMGFNAVGHGEVLRLLERASACALDVSCIDPSPVPFEQSRYDQSVLSLLIRSQGLFCHSDGALRATNLLLTPHSFNRAQRPLVVFRRGNLPKLYSSGLLRSSKKAAMDHLYGEHVQNSTHTPPAPAQSFVWARGGPCRGSISLCLEEQRRGSQQVPVTHTYWFRLVWGTCASWVGYAIQGLLYIPQAAAVGGMSLLLSGMGWSKGTSRVLRALTASGIVIVLFRLQQSWTMPWNQVCSFDSEGEWTIGMSAAHGFSMTSPKVLKQLGAAARRVHGENATLVPGLKAKAALSCKTVGSTTPSTFVADPFLLSASPHYPQPWDPHSVVPSSNDLRPRFDARTKLWGSHNSTPVLWFMFFELKDARTRGLFQNGKGVIAYATSVHDDAHSFVFGGIALRENWHLSYPYVFWHNGKPYMVPEASRYPAAARIDDVSPSVRGTVLLYTCRRNTFPLGWHPVRELASGPFADASMFQHTDSRWYLFTSHVDTHQVRSAP